MIPRQYVTNPPSRPPLQKLPFHAKRTAQRFYRGIVPRFLSSGCLFCLGIETGMTYAHLARQFALVDFSG
jgi:hypothetical protein